MKILMFGWEFPPHITGGLGTACFGLTKGLLKHDVEVLFVVPKAYGDEDQEAIKLINASDVSLMTNDALFSEYNEKFSYMEVSSGLLPYIGETEFNRYREKEIKSVAQIGESRIYSEKYEFSGKYGSNLMEEVARYALIGATIASQYDFDIIHAHDWLTYSAVVLAKKVSGKPLVVHMHATEFDRTGEDYNTNVYEIEQKGMQAADRVIAVSNLTRNTVINKYGINHEKVITVHNAVEPSTKDYVGVEKHVKEKVVTFLGRITYQKGPEYFIEAARKILQKDDNVRFVMAGSGDLMEKMIRRVAELRMGTKFHFTGFLRGENVDKMFGMSDVYVMPSVSEPFGISPLEAMRSNVPVVISKQSGVAEVLNNVLKVDFWDIDAMADAIYGLLHYKGINKMCSELGAIEVDNLKWEEAAKKVRNIYDTLI